MGKNLGLAALAAVVIGLVVYLFAGWPPEPPRTAAAPVPFQPQATEPAPTPTDPAQPPLDIPANPRVLVIGDSLAEGYASEPSTRGFAYRLGPLLGGKSVVNGVSGSGYLAPPTFSSRAQKLDPGLDPDLVVLEGGINDATHGGDLEAAASKTIRQVRATYPDTPVVVLGLILRTESATAEDFAAAEATLEDVADDQRAYWISPIDQEWLDAGVDDRYLIEDFVHPNTAGHAYVARRLATALQDLQG